MNKVQAIETLISPYYRENEYPVCCFHAIAWGKSRPFENLTVLDATPIFRNTMVKYKALLAGGARLFVGRATGFPCDEKIVAFLQEIGMPVISSEEVQTEPVDVILDCAASFIHWTARLGTVELTRSGVPKYAKKDDPVFVADGGRIKKIETCLGTGESYFRAMAQLGYTEWTGKRLVIFGSGKVGTGLLTYAKKNGAIAIVVTQPASVSDRVRKLADAIVNCTDIRAVVNAVSDAHAVVTATGIAGALSHPDLVEALIHSPALLANMGVEDEFGAAMPCERVLAKKHTLNFILEEPTHLKYIDATLGLHNEGIRYLLAHPEAQGLIDPPTVWEESLLEITRRSGCLGDEINII